MSLDFTGGCLCGAHTYRIARRHLNAIHCYCGVCRKAHGGAFSTHVVVKSQQLSWRSKLPRISYESSNNAYREFCSGCGTHLLIHGQTGDATLAIPAGTLDGNPTLTILGHMFVADLVDWYEIADDLPQHTGWPAGFGPVALR